MASSFCVVALLISGCAGYRLGPTNGEAAGTHSVQINPFQNKTIEPHLNDYLMTSLRKNVQQDGTYRVDTHDDGNILLSGVILSYERIGLSFKPSDVITPQDYNIRITVQFIARERSTGKLVFDKPVTSHTPVRVSNDITSAERQAIPVCMDDLAKKATSLLVDGTW